MSLYSSKNHDYNWDLSYGDVIGLGLTENNGEIRGWVSKNGKLLNPPSEDEVMRNIDIDK